MYGREEVGRKRDEVCVLGRGSTPGSSSGHTLLQTPQRAKFCGQEREGEVELAGWSWLGGCSTNLYAKFLLMKSICRLGQTWTFTGWSPHFSLKYCGVHSSGAGPKSSPHSTTGSRSLLTSSWKCWAVETLCTLATCTAAIHVIVKSTYTAKFDSKCSLLTLTIPTEHKTNSTKRKTQLDSSEEELSITISAGWLVFWNKSSSSPEDCSESEPRSRRALSLLCTGGDREGGGAAAEAELRARVSNSAGLDINNSAFQICCTLETSAYHRFCSFKLLICMGYKIWTISARTLFPSAIGSTIT